MPSSFCGNWFEDGFCSLLGQDEKRWHSIFADFRDQYLKIICADAPCTYKNHNVTKGHITKQDRSKAIDFIKNQLLHNSTAFTCIPRRNSGRWHHRWTRTDRLEFLSPRAWSKIQTYRRSSRANYTLHSGAGSLLRDLYQSESTIWSPSVDFAMLKKSSVTQNTTPNVVPKSVRNEKKY